MRTPKAKILIADDDQVIADALAVLLNQHGFEAASTYNGAAAVELAQRFRPDAAVLGFVMPGMNGFDTGARIREFLPDVRVVVINESVPPDVIHDMRLRGLDFPTLPGPFDPRILLLMLKSWGLLEAGDLAKSGTGGPPSGV